MSYQKGFVRRNFWICIYRKNGILALSDLLCYFNPDKVRSLFDKGIAILSYPDDGIRLAIIGYRKKPIRFDILAKRLNHFYITKPYGDSLTDIISACRLKYDGNTELYKLDKFNSFLSAQLEDEEVDYISKLDDIYMGV